MADQQKGVPKKDTEYSKYINDCDNEVLQTNQTFLNQNNQSIPSSKLNVISQNQGGRDSQMQINMSQMSADV